MAFKLGSNTVISNTAGFVHSSFETPATPIVSTQVTVTASDGAAYDNFGSYVDIGCGRIVIGAYGVDISGSGSSSDYSGAFYIFNLNGSQLKKVQPGDLLTGSYFGRSVSINNGRIVAGTSSSSDYGLSGYAYVFDLDGNQLAKFRHSDPSSNDRFGKNVDIGCGRIVVSAQSSGTGGAAYIFNTSGTQIAKIQPSDGAAGDSFGTSVAIADGIIVVGSPGDDDNGSDSGSAYIFDLYGKQLAKIKPTDGATNDYFGGSTIAIGSGRIVIQASGINRAYIFDYTGKQIAKIDYTVYNTPRPLSVSDGKIAVYSFANSQLGIRLLDINGNITDTFAPGSTTGTEIIAIGEGRIVSCYPSYEGAVPGLGIAYIYKLPEDHNIYFGKILSTYKF